MIAILVSSSCAPFPRDPEGTLDHASGGVLKVGVSESYPWVVRRGNHAVGVEPELIRRFAESIDADVEWIWGSPEEHYVALEHWDLDLALTGLTESTPWRGRLGMTQPYFTSRIIVARPASGDPISEIEGRRVLVPMRGGAAAWVREQDGIPVASMIRVGDELVAIEDWKAKSLQMLPTRIVLREQRHVIAAPPGENRFLMALEEILHEEDVRALLDEAMRYPEPRPETENTFAGGGS